jgi:nicotinate-nucleotide--dimethylbenzimidazole phosphoribosyltransferase
MTGQPLDDIADLARELPKPDTEAGDAAMAAAGGAGTLAQLAGWIAEWRGRPLLNRPVFALYAAAHAGMGSPAATRAEMEAIAAGDAPISRAAQHLGAGLEVFDLAIDRPVPDLELAATMSERECAATMAFGMEVLAKQPDLLIPHALVEDRVTAAAALACAVIGFEAGDWAPAEMVPRIKAAVARAQAAGGSAPLALLRQLGGRETAAIAGAILAARIQGVPVLIAGYPALAAGAVLKALNPAALDHCRLAAPPHEPGARILAKALGLDPLVDIQTAAEDGTGAAAALCLIRLACAIPAEAAGG